MNLTGLLKTPLQLNAGESAVWVINVDAYPDPVISWAKDGDEDIIRQQSKFSVDSSRTRTVLRISDIELGDTGVYQVHNQLKPTSLDETGRCIGVGY